jgi:hypothetical protein
MGADHFFLLHFQIAKMEFILLFLAGQFVGENFGVRKLFFKFVEKSRVLLLLIFKPFSVLLLALP